MRKCYAPELISLLLISACIQQAGNTKGYQPNENREYSIPPKNSGKR